MTFDKSSTINRQNKIYTFAQLIQKTQMIKKISIALILGIVFILFASGEYYLYQKEKNTICKNIHPLFKQALSIDMNTRFHEQETSFFWGINEDSDSSDQVVVEDKNSTIIFDKKQEMKSYSMEEKQNIVIQSYLYTINPINVFKFDSIFCSLLSQNNIPALTAIRYTDNRNNTVLESNGDNLFYSFTYATDEVQLGMMQEMSIQAFVKIPLSTVISSVKTPMALWALFCIFITGIVFFIQKPRKKRISIIPHFISFKELETDKNVTQNLPIKISDDIFFDSLKGYIYYHERTIKLQKSQSDLLLCFLNAPDHFISNDQMEIKLRGAILDNKTWRSQAIKRLREALAPVSEIRIDNNRGRGYTLICNATDPPI